MVQYNKEQLILSVKEVSLAYDEKKVLNDVNLEIHNITRD
jgi:ABC-type phosphate transport system ATPase subunit